MIYFFKALITRLCCYSRATILVKLQKEHPSQLQFEPGDHIGVFPCNDPNLVEGKAPCASSFDGDLLLIDWFWNGW